MKTAVVTVSVWAFALVVVLRADMCDRRDRRIGRGWKGDVGDLEQFPGGTVRDRLRLRHRVRRFLSFPTGSVLVVTPKLTIPFWSAWDSTLAASQLYAFPIELNLVNGSLGVTNTGAFFINDIQTGRSLDRQRLHGFNFLQKAMESFGLDGYQCLLRTVCEVAEQPLEDLGVFGEFINLFFSAGFGDRPYNLEEYVKAEELGRALGDCEGHYPACPYQLVNLLHSATAYFHHGLAHVGEAAPSRVRTRMAEV